MNDNQDVWEGLRNEARQADKALERQLAALEFLAGLIRNDTQIAASPSSLNMEAIEFSNKSHSHTQHEGEFRDPTTNTVTDTRPTLAKLQQRFDEASCEVESGLRNLERILVSMERASSRNLHFSKHTERFQSILLEKRRLLQHIVNDFRRRKERLELLSGVAERPDRYEEESGVQLLIKEQNAIRHTAAHVDEIVAQTAATQIRLRAQRETFANVGGKLLQIAERVPMIKNLLSRINTRRRREAVVLGSFISICLFVIVLFL
ncbi:unnamed protein product [Phytomonas sp. EM1]|nr:unnamed protein product [Phytomonas sp. EM1]|eukprot:CCW61188.1 unnamed protein product [Phytomonas sp. isolate EM1]